jgi:hypothetical protein
MLLDGIKFAFSGAEVGTEELVGLKVKKAEDGVFAF